MSYVSNPQGERVRKVGALQQRQARRKYGQFLVEGPQGVREAVRFTPDLVRDVYVREDLVSSFAQILELAEQNSLYVHECTAEVLAAMSPDAQGILAVCYTPNLSLSRFEDRDFVAMRNIAVLCEVRDPGNAGTVIRAADAAGADLVMFTDTSVEVFNPKVVRSTAGSLFHLPLVVGASATEVAERLRNLGLQILAADGYGSFDLDDLLDQTDHGEPDAEIALAKPTAWLFGNEAAGLSPDEKSLADGAVRVPIRGHAESLNLATAATVCLYATSRAQRERTH